MAVVIGTRPEAIKMSEVLRLLGSAAFLIHTGQHYAGPLRARVATDLGLPECDFTLAVGGRPRSFQIGQAVIALGDVIRGNRSFRAVVVHGDTNATLAGALAANAEGVPLFHVEAGLRSYDRHMPEEHNRVLTDHLADMCFAPTQRAYANLAAEGISADRIELTGNTIVDVVGRLLPTTRDRAAICRRFGVEPGTYVLATLHRPENSDNRFRLGTILDDLRALEFPVLLPLHPRTRMGLDRDSLRGIASFDPIPPREFLSLLAECRLAITDSGGVQEEVAVLGRRALVVRRSTERPESLGRWSDLVDPGSSLRRLAIQALNGREPDGPPPLGRSAYGDGRASERIVSGIARVIGAHGAVA